MTDKKLLEEGLDKIVYYLRNANIELSNSASDGRLNSALSEDLFVTEIFKYVESDDFFASNNLTVGAPNLNSSNNREWFDFSIESKDTQKSNLFMPVNIKITNMSAKNHAADNLSCKLGIFYALTGLLPKESSIGNGDDWPKFFAKTETYMATNLDKDYYFLVINKADTRDVFWNGLRSLYELRENGNNLPFQCKWSENREKVDRDYYEARDFILKAFEGSIRKRVEIGIAFDKHLKKFIGTRKDSVSSDLSDSSEKPKEEKEDGTEC